MAALVTNVSTTFSGGIFRTGDSIFIQVAFDETVAVTGVPQLGLALGTTRLASYTGLDATRKILNFTYTVQAGDTTADLDYTSSSALSLNGGSIKLQSDSTDVILTLPTPGATGSLGANAQLVVDAVAPVAPSALALAVGSDLGASGTDLITSVSTPVVTGTAEVNSTVKLYDTNGTTELGHATADNTGVWSITSSVLAAGTHSLNAKAIDSAGNIGPASAALTVTIDTTAPSVTSIDRIGGEVSNSSTLSYNVVFSESVTGVSSGNFVLFPTGSANGSVVSVMGSGSSYTVTVDGVIGDGTLRLDANNADLNTKDIAGNALSGTFNAGQSYTVDHTAPTVANVQVPANGTYTTGQNLDFTVNTGEAITVNSSGGTPYLSVVLDTGGTVQAAYVSGSGTAALTFRYVVKTGDADTNGVAVNGLNANGGSLADAVGNALNLTLASVGSTTGVLVDALPPLPPVFNTASVSGSSLVVSYTEATTLDAAHPPAAGAYSVLVGGVANTVTAIAIDATAKTATLTLTTAVAAGQSVSIAYTDPTSGNDPNALQNAAGTDASSFVATAVTNNTVAPPTPPAPPVSGGITVTAPVGGGVLQGTPLADTFIGSSAKDTFYPAGGADSVDGGAGVDTVILAGTRAQYGITHQADGSFSVRSLADSSAVVTVKNVERLTFDNQTIALDVTPASSRVAELYHLTLGRNPEEGGLGFHVGLSTQGTTTAQLALDFVSSAEFAKLYGTPDNTAFVTQLYQNAFARAPDAAGLTFYVNQLAQNPGAAGLANVIANFVDSSEMAIKLAGVVDQGIPLYG